MHDKNKEKKEDYVMAGELKQFLCMSHRGSKTSKST